MTCETVNVGMKSQLMGMAGFAVASAMSWAIIEGLGYPYGRVVCRRYTGRPHRSTVLFAEEEKCSSHNWLDPCSGCGCRDVEVSPESILEIDPDSILLISPAHSM